MKIGVSGVSIAIVNCTIVVVALVATTRMRLGRLVSPISVTLLLLGSIFGVRPLLMLSGGQFQFYGSDVESGVSVALLVGLLAITGTLFGYWLGRVGLEASHALLKPSQEQPPRYSFGVGVGAALGVLALWLVAMLVVGSGPAFIATLFEGRSDAVGAQLAGVPAIIPALPVASALLIALVRIRAEVIQRLSVRQNLEYWGIIALSVIPPAALGTRRFLIPSLIAGVIGFAATRWLRRVSMRFIGVAIVGFLALAVMPFVRSAGSRTGSTDLLGAMADYFAAEGAQGVLESYFLSYDTEMFSYIAYVAPRLGETVPYGLGRGTFGDMLLAPLPYTLAPYETWANYVLEQLYGGTCATLYCPVPSLPGMLFFDWDVLGVFVGMILVGFAMARFEPAFLRFGPHTALLLTAAAFTAQVIRGNPIAQAWIGLQVFVVVIAIEWLMRFCTRTSGPPVSAVSRRRHGLWRGASSIRS